MIITPRLETSRLVLRQLRDDDADAIVSGVGNYDVSKWLSQVPYPYARKDAKAFISGDVSPKDLTWGIEHDGALIGVVSIGDELGYWLARPAWGRGLGFEAVRAAVDFWFSDTANDTLQAGYFLQNERSGLVLNCLGFQPTHVVRQPALALSQDVDCQKVRLSRQGWTARARFDVQTASLRIRELQRTDAAAFLRIATPAVVAMVSSIPHDLSKNAAKAFIQRRRWRGVPGFLLGIENDQGELIGCVGCGGDPTTAMIFLGEEHWAQGFGYEISATFTNEVFRRFPISALYAEHFVDNPASGRILRNMQYDLLGEAYARSEARGGTAPILRYRMTREKLARIGPL